MGSGQGFGFGTEEHGFIYVETLLAVFRQSMCELRFVAYLPVALELEP